MVIRVGFSSLLCTAHPLGLSVGGRIPPSRISVFRSTFPSRNSLPPETSMMVVFQHDTLREVSSNLEAAVLSTRALSLAMHLFVEPLSLRILMNLSTHAHPKLKH